MDKEDYILLIEHLGYKLKKVNQDLGRVEEIVTNDLELMVASVIKTKPYNLVLNEVKEQCFESLLVLKKSGLNNKKRTLEDIREKIVSMYQNLI